MSEKNKSVSYKHILVPEHILLRDEEAKLVLEKYRVKPSQLLFIKSSDPAAREVKAKPGDIIKIIRRSQTAGEAIAYRYVIEG